jgi:hypothetical protein
MGNGSGSLDVLDAVTVRHDEGIDAFIGISNDQSLMEPSGRVARLKLLDGSSECIAPGKLVDDGLPARLARCGEEEAASTPEQVRRRPLEAIAEPQHGGGSGRTDEREQQQGRKPKRASEANTAALTSAPVVSRPGSNSGRSLSRRSSSRKPHELATFSDA